MSNHENSTDQLVMTVVMTDLQMATSKDPLAIPFLKSQLAQLHLHLLLSPAAGGEPGRSPQLAAGRNRINKLRRVESLLARHENLSSDRRRTTMATAKSVDDFPAGVLASDPNEGSDVGDIEAAGGSAGAPAPATTTPRQRGQRLVSLDVFRGITVVVSKSSSASPPPASYVPILYTLHVYRNAPTFIDGS